MVCNCKSAGTLQSIIVDRTTLKLTAFYVMCCLLIWNQSLEAATQVLAASRICSTLMAESFPLHKEVSMLPIDMIHI